MNKNITHTIQVKFKLAFQGNMIRHYFDDIMSQQAKQGKLSETKTHDTCRQQLSKSELRWHQIQGNNKVGI